MDSVLVHSEYMPFLLQCLEWQDLEYLSSASRGLAESLLRDVFFQRSVVAIPHMEEPNRAEVVKASIERLSISTRRVATAHPEDLAYLTRLHHLHSLRIAKPKQIQHDENNDDDLTPIRFTPDNVASMWRLESVKHLEFDAWIDDLRLVFQDMVRVVSLIIYFRYPTRDLNLLDHLVHLELLSVRGESLSNVHALHSMSQLRTLTITSWAVHDIGAVTSLRLLERLDLSCCNVLDLSPISTLTNLRCLKIEETPVTSLQPLSGLCKLEYLSLARSAVTDVGPLLSRAASLTYLDISGCTVTHVEALAYLNMLESLRMGQTTWPSTGNEPDIASVLHRLQRLHYVDGRIKHVRYPDRPAVEASLQFASFQRMQLLQYLELMGDDVAWMQNEPIQLPNLVWLRVEWDAHTDVLDVPVNLVIHPRLHTLHLSRLQISHVENLQYSHQLRELWLIDVFVDDLSSLPCAPNLTRLSITCPYMHECRTSDSDNDDAMEGMISMWEFTSLQYLTKMEVLDLSFTRIANLTPISHLVHLRSLNLSSTNVRDITPILQLRRLECLYLRDTCIRHIDSHAAFLPVLREIALPEHIDCREVRSAPHLRKLLHPQRDCRWFGHSSTD